VICAAVGATFCICKMLGGKVGNNFPFGYISPEERDALFFGDSSFSGRKESELKKVAKHFVFKYTTNINIKKHSDHEWAFKIGKNGPQLFVNQESKFLAISIVADNRNLILAHQSEITDNTLSSFVLERLSEKLRHPKQDFSDTRIEMSNVAPVSGHSKESLDSFKDDEITYLILLWAAVHHDINVILEFESDEDIEYAIRKKFDSPIPDGVLKKTVKLFRTLDPEPDAVGSWHGFLNGLYPELDHGLNIMLRQMGRRD